MKKIAVIIANGTEEIEAVTPIDVLRRCEDAKVDVFGVGGKEVKGSHGIKLKADKDVEDLDMNLYDAIVLPGGMPGATNIADCAEVTVALRRAFGRDKVVAAICASPAVILADGGFIDGMCATCYPNKTFKAMMDCCEYTGTDVEIDDKLITANGPKAAMEFSLAICEALELEPKF